MAPSKNWPNIEPPDGVIYLDQEDIAVLLHALNFDQVPNNLAYRLQPQVGAGLLESALAVPEWPFIAQFHEKAAALQFHLIQNHPFIDGNKRFALAAVEFFLLLNGAVLAVSDVLSVQVGLSIANGSMSKDELTHLFRRRIRAIDWTPNEFDSWFRGLSQEDFDDVDRAIDEYMLKSPALQATSLREAGIGGFIRRRRAHVPPRWAPHLGPGDLDRIFQMWGLGEETE